MKNNEESIKRVIPMFMLVFITSATMLSVFNIISPQLMKDFKINATTVSLLSMTAMLMMGVASVVYSTLSDYVSIQKMMVYGIILLNIGAFGAFLSSGINFYALLCAVGVMIFGGTCGSGLMIITVTRYIQEQHHAKYYGYNTACVSISQAVGVLAGGFFATYIGWKFLFCIPFLSLLTLYSIKKYVPNETINKQGKLDIVGLGLLTIFTLFISLYFNTSNWILFVTSILILFVFFVYITKVEKAFINIQFFKNKGFVTLMAMVAIVFGLQTAFSFLFPFLMQGVYEMSLDKISLILVPSYIIAAITAMNSGRIVEKLGNHKTLFYALTISTISSVAMALLLDKGIMIVGIIACIYSASFALMYAPFMKLVIKTLQPTQIGVGIGFFNLMTSIGPSLLIVMTGKLLNTPAMAKQFGLVSTSSALFSNILFVFAGLLCLVCFVIIMKKNKFEKESTL